MSYIDNISETVLNSDEFTSEDFLELALELEEQYAEGHLLMSFNVEDNNIKSLLESIIYEDRTHIKRISDTLADLRKVNRK